MSTDKPLGAPVSSVSTAAATATAALPTPDISESSYMLLVGDIEEVLAEGSTSMANEEDFLEDIEEVEPENTVLSLPSNLDIAELKEKGLGDLISAEIDIRKGHLNDVLDQLRVVLGTRNVLLGKGVRNLHTQKTNTRAWSSVNEYTRERNLLVRLYFRSRQALMQLGVDTKLFKTLYQPITAIDLKISGDITEINRFGQKNDRLPWFWRLERKELAEGTTVMQECM